MLKVIKDLYDPHKEGFEPTLTTLSPEECEQRVIELHKQENIDDNEGEDNVGFLQQ